VHVSPNAIQLGLGPGFLRTQVLRAGALQDVSEALYGSRKGLPARRPVQQPIESSPEEKPEDREHQYRAAEARDQLRGYLLKDVPWAENAGHCGDRDAHDSHGHQTRNGD